MAFILTFLAGCSTLLGFLFIYFNNSSNKVLISSLAFAGGVMFLISITDLIPSSFVLIRSTYYIIPAILICSLFVVIGVIISMMIDKYLPDTTTNTNNYNKGLYRAGIISMLGIIIHNVPEDCSYHVSR